MKDKTTKDILVEILKLYNSVIDKKYIKEVRDLEFDKMQNVTQSIYSKHIDGYIVRENEKTEVKRWIYLTSELYKIISKISVYLLIDTHLFFQSLADTHHKT